MNSRVDWNLCSSKEEVLGDFYIYAGKSMLILSYQDTLPVRRWNSKFFLLYKTNLSVTNAKVGFFKNVNQRCRIRNEIRSCEILQVNETLLIWVLADISIERKEL